MGPRRAPTTHQTACRKIPKLTLTPVRGERPSSPVQADVTEQAVLVLRGALNSQIMVETPMSAGSSGRWRGLCGGRVDRLYVGAHVIDQQHGIRGQITQLLDDDPRQR
jgi:hypothetical protein